MDLKLKNLFKCIKTFQIVKISNNDNGESFYPNYSDLTSYGEYFVIDIQSDNDKLLVTIQKQI